MREEYVSHCACGGEMIILKFSLKIISKDYSKVQFSLTSIDDIGKKKGERGGRGGER